MTDVAFLRKGKMNMGACEEESLLLFLLFLLKLHGPQDFWVGPVRFLITEQNLQTKGFLGLRNSNDAVDGMVVDPCGYLEPEILEDRMDRID